MEIRDFRINEAIGKRKAVVIIVHGMQEHLLRYTDFAKYLASQGYTVVRYPLIGHGPTVSELEKGYFGRKDGWKKLVQQLKTVVEKTAKLYPHTPIVVYGHSLGSMIARAYIQDFDHQI